jgi:hypothetical protein
MRPHVRISRHIVGHRMRLKISNATPELLNEVRKRVLTLAGVQSVDTNPITGSLLILYSGDKAKDLGRSLADRVKDLVVFASESQVQSGDYSTTAVDFLKVIKRADDGLRNNTDGRLDLKLLFPLAMAGLAVVTLPTNLQTPLWLSFLMFGYSSFESMHTGALEQPAGKLSEEHESNAAGGASQG